MIKTIRKFINFFICILYVSGLLAAFYYNCKINVNFEEITFSFELYELISIITAIIILKLFFNFISNFITSTFKKNNHANNKKIIDLFQKELSYLLLKDSKLAQKELNKIKNIVDNMPILDWLQGNIYLLNNNENKAQEIFHKISLKKIDNTLGLYSLYTLALKNKNKKSEKEILTKLLDLNINKPQIISKLIGLELLEKNFKNAHYFASLLENNTRKNNIIAIIKYLESLENYSINNKNLLKQAFELSPEIPAIAVAYADELISSNDTKLAKKCLFESWIKNPNIEVFSKYLNCLDKNQKDPFLKEIDKLVCARNDSWIGYFEFGKILFSYEKYEEAFLNFLTAYGKNQSKEIVEFLTKTANKLPEPKSLSAQEVLNGKLEIKESNHYYICNNCGYQSYTWHPICNNCHDIATLNIQY